MVPRRSASGRFIGRAAELDLLWSALATASKGRPSVVVIGGEAGVGKSRLLAEFVGGLPPGTVSALGHCLPCRDGGVPYAPWMDVVRALGGPVEQFEPDQDRELLARRSRFFDAVRNVVAGAAGVPLVVALEDLHWADGSTCDLLTYVLANLLDEPVLLLVTYRSDDVMASSALRTYLAELCRRTAADRIELARFTRDEVAAKVADLCGEHPSASFVDAVWTRSDGNPFFAEELVASASEGAGLGVTLRDILTGRLRALEADSQRVVRAAAAGGNVVPHKLLAAVVADEVVRLDGCLREATEHQLLFLDRNDDAWQFRHVLVREVAYDELLPGERADLHARYAAALAGGAIEVRSDRLASELARHWLAAGETDRAYTASIAAAQAAEALFGFAEAEDHYLTVLSLHDRVVAHGSDPPLSRSELCRRAARAAHLAGDHTRAADLVLAAMSGIDDGDPGQAAVLSACRGRYLGAAGETEEALRAHEEACRLVPQVPPSPARAEVVGAHAEALVSASRYRDALPLARESLALAQALGARAEEGHALATLGLALAQLDDDRTGLAHLHKALEIAEEVGRPDDVGAAYVGLCELLAGPLNRVEEAVSLAHRGISRARALGTERTYGVSLQSVVVNGLFRLGRWDEADAVIDRLLDQRPTGAVAIGLHLAQGRLAVGRGRFEEAKASLDRASTLCARAVDARHTAPLSTLVAGLALWEGRLDDAREAVGSGLSAAAGTDDVWHLAPLVWHGLRVEAEGAADARARRDESSVAAAQDSARALLERMQHLARSASHLPRPSQQIVDAYELLCRAEYSRVLGTPAGEPWMRAAEAWTAVGQPYPSAYARYRAAEALLAERQGRVEPARLLADAHRAAVGLGAKPFAGEIEALAARARIVLAGVPVPGPSSPSAPPVNRYALTERETEVLRLVAEGRTNREIAEALFISAKTASVHVSNILTKLGVGTRVEAAAVAFRLGRTGGGDTAGI